MNDLTLTFEHPRGHVHTLAKHPTIRIALRRGEIIEQQARLKPWYLRAQFRPSRPFRLCANDADAITAAKDILRGRVAQPDQFSAWCAALDAKRGVTVGALAADWFAAGCPFDAESPRNAAAAAQVRYAIERALPFWQDRRVLGITHKTMTEFAGWRRQHIRPGATGSRSVDLELAALSSLCHWAVLAERLDKNPFAKRKHFQDSSTIRHCHQAMPANDDQFNAVLAWHFADETNTQRVCAGAALAFGALTGLRPGEPGLLQRHPRASVRPDDLKHAPPGLIYPMPDGSWKMRVIRTKRGQNPAVVITPLLEDFLNVWTAWQQAHFSISKFAISAFPPLFPIAQAAVAGHLKRACAALRLPAMKPHGFTRAYYVRVRRSAGVSDSQIGVELGQAGNGELIRRVYGDPGDDVGGNLYDWLPSTGSPAWELLKPETASNIIAL